MAHTRSLAFIPAEAADAFAHGDERLALTLLGRERDSYPVGSLHWAQLERLVGLVLIHTLREVEGTFALERADAALDAHAGPRPDLTWLEAAQSDARPLKHLSSK